MNTQEIYTHETDQVIIKFILQNQTLFLIIDRLQKKLQKDKVVTFDDDSYAVYFISNAS